MRAQREAKLAAKLNHPHVVAVFDFVSERDEQWLVMEHVDGADLAVLAEHVRRAAAGRGGGAAGPGRRGPGRRARGGHRAPGRQAVQRAGDARGHREAGGLRHRPGARLDDDGVRSGVGLTGVPRARGGLRSSGHRGQRRLVARRDAVPGPHRPAAVRHLRQRPVGHVPHRARGTAPPARPRVARRPARDHDGHRPRGPLADEPRPRLPRWPGRRTSRSAADVPRRRRRRSSPPPLPMSVETAVQPEVPAERRSWLLPALLALAVLAVGAGLGWLVLRPDSTPTAEKPSGADSSKPAKPTKSPSRTPSPTESASEPASTPSTASQSAPSSASAEPPTGGGSAAAMSTFVQQYVDTALADPAAAWDLLTPRFQQDCCTSEGSYAGYWNTIETATLRDVKAEPGADDGQPTRSRGTRRASAVPRTRTSPWVWSRTATAT